MIGEFLNFLLYGHERDDGNRIISIKPSAPKIPDRRAREAAALSRLQAILSPKGIEVDNALTMMYKHSLPTSVISCDYRYIVRDECGWFPLFDFELDDVEKCARSVEACCASARRMRDVELAKRRAMLNIIGHV